MIKAIFIDYMGTVKEETNDNGREALRRLSDHSNIRDIHKTNEIWLNEYERLAADSCLDKYRSLDEITAIRLRDFVGKYELKDDPAEIHRLFRDSWVRTQAYPDSQPFLSACTLPVYLISNSSASYVLDGMKFSNLAPFAGIIDCDEVRIYKPHREIFERGLEAAGCSAEEAVHIGDSLTKDYRGATAAGLHAIWLNRNGKTEPEGVRTVKSLLEVPEVIRQLNRGSGA